MVNQYPDLGYKLVGPHGRKRVVLDPEEQEWMKLIFECSQKGLSTKEIYWGLCRNHVWTKHGREWTINRINRAIQIERNRRQNAPTD